MTVEKLTIIQRLLFLFFKWLYHPFAWLYDVVADTVSLARWKSWVYQATSFIQGNCILELGFGPGHLQYFLTQKGKLVFGIDESKQMVRLAKRRYRSDRDHQQTRLVRGIAQHLPFGSLSMDTVVATFPTPYIFDPLTIAEIDRVMKPGGSLVILISAWITGKSLIEKLLYKVYAITGETLPLDTDFNYLLKPFEIAGYDAHIHWVDNPRDKLLFILVNKQAENG